MTRPLYPLALTALLAVASLVEARADGIDDLLRAGRAEEAVEVAEAAALASPDDLEVQERYVDLLLTLGASERARTTYAKLLEERPDDPDLHYLHGRALLEIDDSREAFLTALRFDPDHARSFMGLAALDRTAGRLQSAAASYQRALRRDPSLAEAWAGLLSIHLTADDPEGAHAVAKAAVQAAPTAAEPWLTLVQLEPGRAGELLEEAVKVVTPDDARILSALAEQRLRQGDGDGAQRAARRALAADPTHTGARLALLVADSMAAGTLDVPAWRAIYDARRVEADDPAAAKAVYDGLVRTHPRSPLPWMVRARLAVRQGDADAARADLERALPLAPDSDEIQGMLGQILLADEQFERAAKLLVAASEARPWDATLQVSSANATFQAGETSSAIARITRAERLHPYDVEVALTHAHLRSQAGDPEGAYMAARTAAERIPDVRLIMAVGAAAREAGRLEEAAEIYEELSRRTGAEAFSETAALIRTEAARAADGSDQSP